jgi:hypothetical protein
MLVPLTSILFGDKVDVEEWFDDIKDNNVVIK